MKKWFIIICLLATTGLTACPAFGSPYGLDGPAPNSGDGVSDGSGFENPSTPGPGPAPNSGDGVSDGSGF